MSALEESHVPELMSALRILRFGGPEVLQREEIPTPETASDEILIKVAFCGVCRHDLLTRAGAFPSVMLPVTPGHQVSGHVAVVGEEARSFSVGQRVMTTIYLGCGQCMNCQAGNQALCLEERPTFLGEDIDGGYAEYVKVRYDTVLPVPDALSLQKAAVITCTLGTAYHAVVTQASTSPGDTVVITGASGGVGIHSIKIAKYFGARVFAVTSNPSKRPLIERAGADEVLLSPNLTFRHEVKSLTEGKGADVVIEIVGASTLNESIHSVRNGGKVVLLGNVDGKPVEIRPAHFILKEIGLIGTKSCTLPELEEVLELIASGDIDVDVAECIPLDSGAEVHSRMEEGQAQGRIVVEVSGES